MTELEAVNRQPLVEGPHRFWWDAFSRRWRWAFTDWPDGQGTGSEAPTHGAEPTLEEARAAARRAAAVLGEVQGT